MIKRLGKIFLDYLRSGVGLLFPRVCVVCGDVLVRGERFMCSGCLCRMPLNEGADEGADERMKEVLDAENLFWLFTYNRESDFHQLIYAIKYKSRRELGVWAGRMLGERIGTGYGIDCVIPVPLHPAREKERGFNQSLAIGTGIAGVLGVKIVPDVLERKENTRSQTGLSREERADNVMKAFRLTDPGRLRGCHVLLVDDVLTSGATTKACLAELRKIEGVRCSVACLGKAGKI
ncbi:ComF family protein [uncultured Butyricimonas sp.]|uniref:ComF family protein n=1 Tax=uncultured Butyricimonas sp. TaxID=1268785 RepID=UPI0026DCEA2D|nr:phosphoribosyltransferase family protein [uncultured Butyricimonas sp.]